MNIEYQLTRKDYREFLKLTYQRIVKIGKGNIKFFALNLVAWIFFGMALAETIRLLETYNWIDFLRYYISLIFLAFLIIGLFAISIYQRRFYMHYSIDDKGYLLQKHSAEITEEGIKVNTSEIYNSYSWGAFQGQKSSKNLVCLYIDNGQALILPKRAFQSEEQFDEFLSLFDSKTK